MALRSAPGGHRIIGRRGLALGLALVCAAPVLPGLIALLLFVASGQYAPVEGEPALLWVVWMSGLVLVYAPLLSWIGLLLALPGIWWLLRAGWFGVLPAMLLGAIAGVVSGWAVDVPFAPAFGALTLLALRFWCGLAYPAIRPTGQQAPDTIHWLLTASR